MQRLRCVLVAALLATVFALTGATTATAADLPPVSTAAPSITGEVAVGQVLTADPGTWDPADVTYAYTWLVNDQVAGTGEQYTPVAGNEGRSLSLRVVAKRPDGTNGTATSEPVTVLEGGAPQNLEPPVVSGGRYPGEVLQASAGTWDTEGLGFSYQWQRGGAPITDATGPSYTLTRSDWCQELSVVVMAELPGHATGVVTSEVYKTSCLIDWDYPVPVNVQIRAPQHVTTQDRARVRVRVTGAGNANPSDGSITLRVTALHPRHASPRRWERTVHLHPEDSGRVTFRLPKLSAGKHRVAVRYDRAPDSQFMDGDNVTVFKVVQAD